MGSKKGMQQVVIVGNLGRDAELKYSGNGKPIVTGSAAVTTGHGEYEHTEWFNLVAFGERFVNVAPYLKKGQQVGVTGQLKTRAWEDQNGQKRYRTELIVETITLLGNGDSGRGQGAPAGADDAPDDGEDIPF
jgi:single-strand DNA-binding protein